MILLLVKLSHLFLVLNSVVYAIPIIGNRSESFNNTETATLNAAQKQMVSEYHISKLAPALLLSQIIPKFQRPKNFNLSEVANALKKFGIHSLHEDKHIEAVPLERDGRINPDFHKEIFLGNHELFEDEMHQSDEKRNSKLQQIFLQVDINRDERVTKDELLSYVLKNVEQHTREAVDRNSQLFLMIDVNQDGKVAWNEYYALYVKFHGMNSTNMTDPEVLNFIHNPVDDNFKRELIKIRYRWVEADVGGDNELDIDEFLAFRHPEIAGHSYKHIVDDLIAQMDRNDDQKLNETEFAFLPASVLEDPKNKEWAEMDRRWLEDQKREFHEMDENNDGIVTKEELQNIYNPMNRAHINKQINRLFSKVDDSPKDNALSLDEIQKHADVFTDMRILDTEKSLHDEM